MIQMNRIQNSFSLFGNLSTWETKKRTESFTMWTKKERFEAVLNHELADRPPVSAWRHFTEKEHSGADLFVETMLKWQNTYDWDYVKLQPRASYYEEAWGGRFDYNDYEGVLPKVVKDPISGVADLEKITVLPGDQGVFAEQIEVIQKMKAGLNEDIPMFQTMMCPTSVLQKLCAVNPIGRYRAASRDDLMMTLMHEQPELIHKTLQNITDTMADYSKHLIEDAGLYGVFYGATGLSRSTYMTKEEWEEFVKPYDLQMMEALKPCKIMVHACGLEVNPEYFAHYPIDILHWPESAAGNPKLDTAPQWLDKSITPMGGCDERLFGQHKAEEIAALTRNTLKRMKDIPFVLAPDCSLATNTYDEELRAFIEAAHSND